VLTRLAVGGMAEIYRARARSGELAGREVVLKRLLPLHRSEPAYVELFLAEARLGALVVHPNIVRTHDLFRRGRDYFIVQELVGGDTLGRLVEAARARGSRVAVDAALVCVADLLSALAHLHAGAPGPFVAPGAALTPIIHRDVNPDNVVAAPEGVAKLIDFGIAEAQGASQTRERSGALRGTPAYMSPEQVKSRPLDPSSDLFSAGVVLWELLANRTLFAQANEFETLRHVCEVPATPLRLVDPSLPASFERLCVRALARERERRFQRADEFLAELRDAAHREGFPLDRASLAAEVARLVPAAPRAIAR
jgi:serine/threonine protein kinase